MRVIGRLLLLLMLLLSANWVWQESGVKQWKIPRWFAGEAIPDARLELAQPSTVYHLDNEQWLDFVVTGNGPLIKVISNASIILANNSTIEDDRIWNYALEYQLFDADGELLEQRDYHHRSKQVYYNIESEASKSDKHALTGRLSRYFYLDNEQQPISSASLRINIKQAKRPLTLKLRLAHAESGVMDVMARVYQPNPVLSSELGLAWQRLSLRQRERMARGNVYGSELLQELEAQNLMRNRYLPIGPQGVRGEDYHDRVLYNLGTEELKLDKEGVVALPTGLYADQWLRGVIKIPKQGAKVNLTFKPFNRILGNQEKVILRWSGTALQTPFEKTVLINGQTLSIAQSFPAGLVEIIAVAPVLIDLHRLDSDRQSEIEQGSFYLKSYRLIDNALEYRIDHISKEASPFRIDLRLFKAATDQDTNNPKARYELLDKQGAIVKSGILGIESKWSQYDRFSTETSGIRITEASRYYFSLPTTVDRIRITSTNKILATAYTRPHDLQRVIRLPEDRFAQTAGQFRQPAWFIMHPQNKTTLTHQQRSTLLQLQSRPNNPSADLQTGRYQWQSFQPEGDEWQGRHLLQEREENAPLREQSLAAVYHEVLTGTAQTIQVKAVNGVSEVTPNLLFIRDNEQVMQYKIIIDGEVWLEDELVSQRGRISLPPLSVGPHTLTIESSGSAQWLINQSSGDKKSYLKRMAQRINNNGLSYIYNKEEQSTLLSAQLFIAQQSTFDRVQLNITIEALDEKGIGPFKSWSFLQRTNDIRLADNYPLPVLNTRSESVSEGERLFIPLGSDLKKGRYRINFEFTERMDGYLSLYQLTPGSYDSRHFFTEQTHGEYVNY